MNDLWLSLALLSLPEDPKSHQRASDWLSLGQMSTHRSKGFKGGLPALLQVPEWEARSWPPLILDLPNRKGVWMLNNAKWHIAFSLMIINVTHLEGICKRLIMFWRGLHLINYTSITSSLYWFTWINIFISMLTNLLGWLFIFNGSSIWQNEYLEWRMSHQKEKKIKHIFILNRGCPLRFQVKIILSGI